MQPLARARHHLLRVEEELRGEVALPAQAEARAAQRHLLARRVAALEHVVEGEGGAPEVLAEGRREDLARALLEVARDGDRRDLLAAHARLPLRVDARVREELREELVRVRLRV